MGDQITERLILVDGSDAPIVCSQSWSLYHGSIPAIAACPTVEPGVSDSLSFVLVMS